MQQPIMAICSLSLSLLAPVAPGQNDDYSDLDRQIEREERQRRTSDYSDLDRQIARDDYNTDYSGAGYPSYDTYFTVGGAAVFPGDSDLLQFNGVAANGAATLEFDTGYSVFAALGNKSGAFRTEGEFNYRDLQIDRIDSSLGDLLTNGGQLDVISSMFNIYYDAPIAGNLEFFIGGGVGVVYIEGDFLATVPGAGSLFLSGDSFEFAYQGLVGLSTRLNDNLYLTAGYRLFTFTDPDFDGNEYEAPLVHSIDIGLRIAF